MPTVRCISRSTLIRSLCRIRDRLAVTGHKNTPGKEILQHLTDAGIVDPIFVRAPDDTATAKFYAIGLGVDADDVLPLKLLMAMAPRGVICYFSALEYYSLTTQVTPQHHIAHQKDYGSQSAASATGTLGTDTDRSFNPQGTEQFTYRRIPYYTTNRDAALLPEIQTRHLNDKSIIRITTLEQTLLDTLHRPLSCGGPNVIFEVWDTAADDVNPRRLGDYLQTINDPALDRRAGFLLDSLGQAETLQSIDRLKEVKPAPHRTSVPVIPLFQGYQGSYEDDVWRVTVP